MRTSPISICIDSSVPEALGVGAAAAGAVAAFGSAAKTSPMLVVASS
jgi:hypothetical protein